MPEPQAWSAYAAGVPVLKNRRQSAAFLLGLGLKPQALRPFTNHIDKKAPAFEDWQTIDSQSNFGCPLTGDFLDIDVDVRSKSGRYDAAFFALALPVLELVEDALVAAGVQFRGYGRTSFGCRGHFIVEVPVLKGEEDLLRRLHMRAPVECNGVMVRIEVRRRPAKNESTKNFTLPGSCYIQRDKQGLDLIQWTVLDDWRADEPMPKLEPQKYETLRLGMYMALMALAILPYWEKDNRHHCAFAMSGALAHEWREGTFTEDEVTAVMAFIVEQASETGREKDDRLRCLSDALAAIESGNKVTGYTRLAEDFIGDEWKAALLRLRGGGDPDAVGRLFEIVARVNTGLKKPNVYVDLSAGADRYAEMDQAGLRHRFKYHPEFPPVPTRNGKFTPAIEVVMHSENILTYAQAVSFPGIPFGVVYSYDHQKQEYVEVVEKKTVGETLYLNVASGFKTKPYAEGDAPDPHVYREATAFWFKLRRHLTCSDAEQAGYLDQLIAHKLQRVREKQQVGCALVGGAGIGKTFLFDIMLASIIGDGLIKKSSTAELKSEFRFNGIDSCLFYTVEECRFDRLPAETLQMIKDMMRNRRIHRNVKYGETGAASNVAMPFFMSNELNPRLSFDGVPDRALVIIRGEHQAALGMSADEWEDHQKLIHEELADFAKELKREDIRRAILHYFLELELNDEVFLMNERRTDAFDFEEATSPIQAALLAILREGYIMPLRRGERGPSIRQPFAMETLAQGLRERLKDQRVSTFETTPARVGIAVAELFREGARRGSRPDKLARDIDRKQRDKVMKMVRYRVGKEIDMPIYYFSLRRGALLALLEERTGFKVEPNYQIDDDGELGPAPEPSRADLAQAYKFAADQQDGFGVRMGLA